MTILPPPDEKIPLSLALETERLLLRLPKMGDVDRLVALAGHPDIAATTLLMPHPYTRAHGEDFVRSAAAEWSNGSDYIFAVVSRGENLLIGVMGLTVTDFLDRAELGYWIGKPYWGRGYATEAARRLVQFSFEALDLNRVYAACFAHNLASARVMEKAGMTYEGTLRQHYKRFGVYHDGRMFAILRSEWQARP